MHTIGVMAVCGVIRFGAAATYADTTASSTPPPDAAQEVQSPSEAQVSDNQLRVEFTPWVWVSSVSGTSGARGLTADVDASFGDILEASDSVMAFSGYLEVGQGPWGMFADVWYADIGADDQSGPGGVANVDVTFQQAIADFAGMYRVGTWEPSASAASNQRDITLDLYAGARMTMIDLELDQASPAERSRDEKVWVDPIVGAKIIVPFDDRWHLRANADVGGFGVSSDLTWSTTVLLGYDFRIGDRPVAAYLGYRAIGWDYSSGTGADEFVWDITMHGPIVGLSFLW